MRALLIVALFVACKSEERAPQQERASVVACFGDELPQLKAKPSYRDCEDDMTKCREDCRAADGEACFALALELQLAEHDEPTDSQETRELFARGCRLGIALACTNWGADLMFNDLLPDLRCLYRVFAAACEAKDTFGCSMMARIKIEHPDTPFDPWIGYSQLVNACDRFNGPPCRFLAWHLERGNFGGADEIAIKLLLTRACEGGDVEACDRERAQDAMLD